MVQVHTETILATGDDGISVVVQVFEERSNQSGSFEFSSLSGSKSYRLVDGTPLHIDGRGFTIQRTSVHLHQ
jgi:hypothetical protein